VKVDPKLALVNPNSMNPNSLSSTEIEALRQMLSETPAEANTIISGHIPNIKALISGIALEEGEAAIIRPKGQGQFDLVDEIKLDEWSKLPHG
jgi:hypothetical protein